MPPIRLPVGVQPRQLADCAQKLLAYLGDFAVTGSQIKGQVNELKFKGPSDPCDYDSNGKTVDIFKPCEVDWRNILQKEGLVAFAKAVRECKDTLISWTLK